MELTITWHQSGRSGTRYNDDLRPPKTVVTEELHCVAKSTEYSNMFNLITYKYEGRGANLLRYIEKTLIGRGARLLLVETSGLPSYSRARSFYKNLGKI